MTNVDELLGPGALFQGRFRIQRALGRGGMGEVWAALDTALERPVAIKIIHRELAGSGLYSERFLRETKLAARVAHPCIVRLYDAGTAADGRLFMVMELASGVPLRRMLDGGARLDPVRALHCAIQIAEALGAAHDAALVHRDVKPENILVSDEGKARLLDFGVAKDLRSLGLTGQGVLIGTLRYMAPEQITGIADARADLYALGVVLYEMLAGAHPYPALDGSTGVGETEMMAAHVHLQARPLPEVLPGCPEALWRAISRCLAKDPEARFPRASALAEALREAARGSMPPEHPGARQLLREAEEMALARAAAGSAPRRAEAETALASTERATARLVPSCPTAPGVSARASLAMARMFEVVPAAGAAGAGAAAGGRPSPPPVAGVPAAGDSTLASTEPWIAPPPFVAGAAPLARTEPWDGAGRSAQRGAAANQPTPRPAWGPVAATALVLGLVSAVIAAWVSRLAP